jgi:Cu/Ag efflux pump CusA
VKNWLITVVNKGERYIYFFVSLKYLPFFILFQLDEKLFSPLSYSNR